MDQQRGDGHDFDRDEDKTTTTSDSRSGEDLSSSEQEAGREETGTRGETERPTGTSSARDVTGIDPQDPITREEDSPAG